MMKKLRHILNIDFLISGVAFSVLVLVTAIGVVMRYVFNNSLVWQEEAQLFLIVWIVYFGLSAAMRERAHVAIELVVDAFPRPIRRVVELLGQLVVILVLGYVMVRGIAYVQQMGQTHRMTNLLKVPYAAIYSALPIGCGLTIINQILLMYEDLTAPKKEVDHHD